MLEFMTGWGTPTSLFLLLNLVIGTIWLTSLFGTHNRQHQSDDPYVTSTHLAQPRSLLDRVRSFNYTSDNHDFTFAEPQPFLTRAPSLLDRVKSASFKKLHSSFFPSEPIGTGQPQDHSVESAEVHQFSCSRSEPPNPEQEIVHEKRMDPNPDHQVKRSKSDGEFPARRGAEKMMKSASEKKLGLEKSEEVERRRPATARIERRASIGADVEVDARADDFINRFKQQLKLQRLDSLIRYRDMITRGASH